MPKPRGTTGVRARRRPWTAALVCALALASHHQTAVADGFEPAGDPAQEANAFLDETHAQARRTVADVADRLDRFFVDERIDEGLNRTRLRLGVGVRVSESRGVDPLVRFRLDLSLPRTERRVALVVSSLGDDDGEEGLLGDLADDGNLAGFLRLFAVDEEYLTATLDGGLRFSPEPDPFTRLRFFRDFPWGRTLIRPTQQFYWRSSEGVGERTRFDIDRRFGINTLARLRAQATYSQVTDGVDLDLATFLFRQLSARSAMRIELGIQTLTDPPRVVETYRTGVRLRRAIYRHWLFAEIEPQLHFRREDDYRFSPGILLRVETIIGPGPDQE